MIRRLATLIAAGLALTGLETAACARAQAAESFSEVPMPPPDRRSHVLAYTSLASGAGLIGASFLFAHRADDTYRDYLVATDPDRITDLFDRTIGYDRLSRGSLLTGEALIATGLYLRFLRPPRPQRVSFDLGPRACALSVRF
jgi:hypothetical protein